MLRDYQVNDLSQMCRIWNAVVAQGNVFLSWSSWMSKAAMSFFPRRAKRVSASMRILWWGCISCIRNNVGRCGHICNASFAVNQKQRGKHIGKALVLDCMKTARSLGFRILQFNAVVESNASARHLYESLGFHSLGTIPGGFLQSDGAYVNIVPYYISLTE